MLHYKYVSLCICDNINKFIYTYINFTICKTVTYKFYNNYCKIKYM